MSHTYVIGPSCINCAKCSAVCPAQAVVKGRPTRIDPARCVACGYCVAACPYGFITKVAVPVLTPVPEATPPVLAPKPARARARRRT